MSARSLPLLVVLGLVVGAVPARAQQAQTVPALIVRVRSIDGLIADAKHLAALAGAEEQAKQIDALVRSKIGAKGLEGIDTSAPGPVRLHRRQRPGGQLGGGPGAHRR